MAQVVNLLKASLSGGQIGGKYLGNVQQDFYQTGAQYINNAVLTPNGSVKKRPGTRFVSYALGGKETKLYAVNSILAAVSEDFTCFYHGNKPIVVKRVAPVNIIKNTDGTIVTSNVFPSDVFYVEQSKYEGQQFLLTAQKTDNPDTAYYPDFFLKDTDEKYDTYLRTPLDKSDGLSVIPDVSYGTDPYQRWTIEQTNRNINIYERPDAAALVDPVPYIKTYPQNIDVTKYDYDNVHPIFKIRTHTFTVKDGTRFTNTNQYLHLAKTAGLNLYIPQFIDNTNETGGGTQDVSIGILAINVPNIQYPEFFKSERNKDYRSIYLNQDIAPLVIDNNATFQNTVPNAINTSVFRVGTLAVAGVISKDYFGVVGSAIFQGRLVVAFKNGSEVQISFSRENKHTDFTFTSGSAISPTDPFYIKLDMALFATLNVIHEFAGALVIGTAHGVYALYNASGIVNAKTLGQIAKISDIGTSGAIPALHNSNLYMVANNRQTMLQVVKEPMSVLLRCNRIDTVSDALNVNGYITKLVTWIWDHQYLGALTSDGMFLKANLDAQTASFNTWNANKDVILDVTVMTIPDQKDMIYFVINRDAETFIECMFDNQEIAKNYHQYSTFRETEIENERTNQIIDTVLPMYVKNSFYADSAITMKLRNNIESIAVNGSTVTLNNPTSVDIQHGDKLRYTFNGEVYTNAVMSLNKPSDPSGAYTLKIDGLYDSNNQPINTGDIFEFDIERQIWMEEDYPTLRIYNDRDDVAIYTDGNITL